MDIICENFDLLAGFLVTPLYGVMHQKPFYG